MDDAALAGELVRAAGAEVLRARSRPVVAEAKTSATDVVTAADREAEAAMVALLERHRPDDGVVGEEGAHVAGGGRTWVLDALDGTLNFASGLPGFCCAAALVEGERALASAVLDPVAGTLFAAAAGEGARGGSSLLRAAGPERLGDAVIATFGRREAAAPVARLVERAGWVRMVGCGTLELARVAAGQVHGWAQPDPYPWDWYPGALLVVEAGGVVGVVDAGGVQWRLAAAGRGLLGELGAAVVG